MNQIWQVPSECGPSNLVVLALCMQKLLKIAKKTKIFKTSAETETKSFFIEVHLEVIKVVCIGKNTPCFYLPKHTTTFILDSIVHTLQPQNFLKVSSKNMSLGNIHFRSHSYTLPYLDSYSIIFLTCSCRFLHPNYSFQLAFSFDQIKHHYNWRKYSVKKNVQTFHCMKKLLFLQILFLTASQCNFWNKILLLVVANSKNFFHPSFYFKAKTVLAPCLMHFSRASFLPLKY